MRLKSWTTVVAALLAFGCNHVTEVARVEPSSFRVHIVCTGTGASDCPRVPTDSNTCPAPDTVADLGSPTAPVDRSQVFYLAEVSAVDTNGEPYPGFDGNVNVYIQFGGTTTPSRDSGTRPLAKLALRDGKACLAVTIPPAFNQTTIWVEEPPEFVNDAAAPGGRAVVGSFAAGSSETIFRPAPLIADVQRTSDAVTQISPLNRKRVAFGGGTGGAPIVVTFVAPTYFTVTDLGAASKDYAWGSLEVYTSSQPELVRVGSTVANLSGAVSNFLGLPELNFAMYDVVNRDPDSITAPLPAPHRLKLSDLPNVRPTGDPNPLVTIAPYKSGVVELVSDKTTTWEVCALTGSSLTSYEKYDEWVLTSHEQCETQDKYFDIISRSTVPAFDPLANAGKKVCSIRGILNVVTASPTFILWVITPRGPDDLGAVVDAGASCP